MIAPAAPNKSPPDPSGGLVASDFRFPAPIAPYAAPTASGSRRGLVVSGPSPALILIP
jgi:hypothetical protein